MERDAVICEGYVELVFLKKETKRVSRAPEFFLKVIRPFFEEEK